MEEKHETKSSSALQDTYFPFSTDKIEDRLDEAIYHFPDLVQGYECLQDELVKSWKQNHRKSRRIDKLEYELAMTKLQLADTLCSIEADNVEHLNLRLRVANEVNKHLIEVLNHYREQSNNENFMYEDDASGSSVVTNVTMKTLQTGSPSIEHSGSIESQGCLVLTDDKAYMVPIGSHKITKKCSEYSNETSSTASTQPCEELNSSDDDENSADNQSEILVGVEIPAFGASFDDMISTRIEI